MIDLQTPLLGPVDTTEDAVTAAVYYALHTAPAYDTFVVKRVADAIIAETRRHGLRSSIVAAQILLETNRFRYGGQVRPEQFNLAGLGALTGTGLPGASFATPEAGVRAVCQHHCAYLGIAPPDPIIDPRFYLVTRRVSVVGDYGKGVWATDPDYASKLVRIANEIYVEEAPETILTQIGRRIEAHGVEVVDLRGKLRRRGLYPFISPDAQIYTAVHYTGTDRNAGTEEQDGASWEAHAAYHVDTHGWPGISYALGVSQSGRVFLLHEVEEMGYHAFNANSQSFPVAVDAKDNPTKAAYDSLDIVLDVLHFETPELPKLDRKNTYGHKELTFLDTRNITACPGPLLAWVKQQREGDFAPAPAPEVPPTIEFPTGIVMQTAFGFYKFWEANGGVPIFGYPISGEFTEDGKTVQYFQRARFELAVDGQVVLGLVGYEAHTARYGELAFDPLRADAENSVVVIEEPVETPKGSRRIPRKRGT